MRSKNVFHAALDEEVWEGVFKSLREMRAALAEEVPPSPRGGCGRGRATRDTGAVNSVQHPAHANTSKQAPPRRGSPGIVHRLRRRIHRISERLQGFSRRA
ncbi:hypothetical protein GCM10010430_66390 [Kitasatospora cystarginea]|uniref:Uncharacterized protein n=1 Tax=Kitasatospora cystarginea TaxID=58350 RepID=A0ABN3ETY0_9ACTN